MAKYGRMAKVKLRICGQYAHKALNSTMWYWSSRNDITLCINPQDRPMHNRGTISDKFESGLDQVYIDECPAMG